MTAEQFRTQLAVAEGHLHLGEGVEALEVILALPEPFNGSREAQGLRMAVMLLEELWEDAESYGQLMVNLNPHAAEFWYYVAISQARQGKYASAREHLKKALELDPELRARAIREPAFENLW